MRFALLILSLAPLCHTFAADYFTPTHRLSGIGVARDDLSDDVLEARTGLMTDSQTFSILREPMAVPGAKRITTDKKLQQIFQSAAVHSGLPATLIEAIAYLESWGDAKAESPAGPRGIMQISHNTAREMGLHVARTIKYRTVKERIQVRDKHNKLVTKTVRRRVPYAVAGRDERLAPERAVPAAAIYLANLEKRFGGRDWAIFAYHCGEGCVSEMLDLTRRARGIPKDQVTVARMFFSASPVWNRELFEAVQVQMQRDYSPTYWFRVRRAQQLLALYRNDPAGFASLAQEYRSEFSNLPRAPHRLSVWLKRDDMVYHSGDDIRAAMGSKLVRAFDRPAYFGFALHIVPDQEENLEYLTEASPAAMGTLTYIAFETRRLWEEMSHKSEHFVPLPVTSLVEPEEYTLRNQRGEAPSHASGQVFDIADGGLPPAENEALHFVLDDLGWDGYLGFVEEGRENLHIGCAPTARDFFTSVFQEAAKLANDVKGQEGAHVSHDTHVSELH
ncbi:MAG TPA: transglycosylase SLT domain-containing protein [Bryobacteraceae bacterium]|nr:transglycosylase SLT domain-containing protein [Bryobacteraceae bacterium]